MRRLALSLGALSLAPLLGCVQSTTHRPAPGTGDAPATSPSVVAEAPAAARTPTTTSYDPPATVVPVSLPPTPITPGPMLARPVSGGTLLVLSDARTAVAADSDRDQIYVVDLVSWAVRNTIVLKNGDEPGRVVEDADGRVHVALRSGGAIVTIDPKVVQDKTDAATDQGLLARRDVCAAPRGIAFDKATNELHVACAGGELVSLSAAPTATAVTRSLNVATDLRDVVVSSNGRLMVSTFRTAEVYTIDGQGTVSKPQILTKDFSGRAPGVAWRMVGGNDGTCMVLHELSTQQQSLGTFPGAYGVQKTDCSSLVTSTVTVVAPDGDSAQPSVPFAGALVAADVAVSPGGTQMAVVSIANSDATQRVQFFDIADGGPVFKGVNGNCWPQSTSPVADAPAGVGASDGLPAPSNYLPPNDEIVAVAYDPRGNIIVQSRQPANLQILTQRRGSLQLSSDARADDGHQVFHTATSNQIACVSCHPEGGEDGRVWNFQNLGPRRTQSLRGGIMDTAPFHWGGDESNMTALVKDVFQGRMSGGPVDDSRVTALSKWIDGIPTVPTAHPADAAAVTRGATLFATAGCMACHAGNDFTNGATVDVGTGGMFQVPQLHGLGMRAPYMHNGCAATLRDRFSSGCGGDVRHMVGGTFTDAQLTDLVGYLETL
jgi:hypothetical protein